MPERKAHTYAAASVLTSARKGALDESLPGDIIYLHRIINSIRGLIYRKQVKILHCFSATVMLQAKTRSTGHSGKEFSIRELSRETGSC